MKRFLLASVVLVAVALWTAPADAHPPRYRYARPYAYYGYRPVAPVYRAPVVVAPYPVYRIYPRYVAPYPYPVYRPYGVYYGPGISVWGAF